MLPQLVPTVSTLKKTVTHCKRQPMRYCYLVSALGAHCMILTSCILQHNHQMSTHFVCCKLYRWHSWGFLLGVCRADAKKQHSRQNDAVPCANVGFRGPPSRSPQRTLASPDKPGSCCTAGPARKHSVDIGFSRTDRKLTVCVMSLNTSHIQITVTHSHACIMRVAKREQKSRVCAKLDLCVFV